MNKTLLLLITGLLILGFVNALEVGIGDSRLGLDLTPETPITEEINVSNVSHDQLANLEWSVAGHTIDTDVDFNNNSLINAFWVNATYGNFTDLFVSNSTLHIGPQQIGSNSTELVLPNVFIDRLRVNFAQGDGGGLFNFSLNDTLNNSLSITDQLIADNVTANNFFGGNFFGNLFEVVDGNDKAKINSTGLWLSRQDTGAYAQYIRANNADIEINSRSATRFLANNVIRMAVNTLGIQFYDDVNYLGNDLFGAGEINASKINAGSYNWTATTPALDFNGSNLEFNESYLQSVAEVTLQTEVINTTIVGGVGTSTTPVIDFEIKQIGAECSGTTFRFLANESDGSIIDQDRKAHTNNWSIEKNYPINDTVSVYYNNVIPTSTTCTTTIKYLDNFL